MADARARVERIEFAVLHLVAIRDSTEAFSVMEQYSGKGTERSERSG